MSQVLETGGFSTMEPNPEIGGLRVGFDTVLVGTGTSQDLVVVAGESMGPVRALQQISALNRTLDRLESRRPVSLILVGGPPTDPLRSRIESECRLLQLGVDATPEQITTALSVLLPLELPQATGQGLAPFDALRNRLARAQVEAPQDLLSAAEYSADAVRDALRAYISDPFSNPASGSS